MATQLLLLLACIAFVASQSLPPLRVPTKFSFEASYSCGGSYATSGLFIDRELREPYILFNGGCNAETASMTYSLAGDDMYRVCDMGKVALTDISAQNATKHGVANCNVGSELTVGHTYTVLLSRSHLRALFAFTVESIGPLPITKETKMDITYGLLMNQRSSVEARSPDFDWSKPIGELDVKVTQ